MILIEKLLKYQHCHQVEILTEEILPSDLGQIK